MRTTIIVLLLAGAVLGGDPLKDLRSPDPAVREEAVRALGELEDQASLKALRWALKRFSKEPDLLSAVVTSLGAREDVDSAGAVADLARKSLGSNAGLVRACIDALGQIRAEEALAGLMDLHASAGDVRKGGNFDLLPEIRESLRELTGLPFRQHETWVKWWKHTKKRWRPTALEPAAGAALYRSDGWRFSLATPSAERWVISRPAGTAARVLFSGPADECRFAYLDVLAHAVLEGKPETPREAAERFRTHMEKELREIRPAGFGVATKLSGVKALRHEAVGILTGGTVIRWRAFFLLRNGILYTISVGMESGAGEAVAAGLEEMLESFVLLDR